MYVIADIEWVDNWINRGKNIVFPAQIAAARVDENLNIIARFSALIKPDDKDFNNWDHIAFSGGTMVDFYCAKSAKAVINEFSQWLKKDDVIVWWHKGSKLIFKTFYKKYLGKNEPHQMVGIRGRVLEFIRSDQDERSLYKVAESLGIETLPKLMHNSENDVKVLYKLLKEINMPLDQNRSRGVKFAGITREISAENSKASLFVSPLTRRERNAQIIRKGCFSYVYLPNSEVFHRPCCSRIHNAKDFFWRLQIRKC